MLRIAAVFFMLALCASLRAAEARHYFVAVDGKADNAGTKEAPWDIDSALGGKHKVEPGATLWIRGGTYRSPDRGAEAMGFSLTLAGTEQAPVVVRAWPGERATIDGGLTIDEPATDVRLQDLEITVTEPNRLSRTAAVTPGPDIGRPYGSLQIRAGARCKFINLVVHAGRQGVAWWKGSTDSELYGCLIYDNGWRGPDKAHGGHEIYTQNQNGVKTISDCIIARGYTFSMHAYGSKKAFVDNYVIENNICYNDGPFLIGGDSPSHNCKALNNCLHNVPMWVGYYGKGSQDCEVRGNVLTNAGLEMRNYVSGVVENNLIVNGDVKQTDCADLKLDNNTVVPAADAAKREPLAVLRPNKYDATRANLAICNWPRGPSVTVEASAFLKDGEAYELRDPLHFYEAAVHWGFCKDGKITVPMYGEEFAAFVMFKVKI